MPMTLTTGGHRITAMDTPAEWRCVCDDPAEVIGHTVLYQLWDSWNRLLYVGITWDVERRWRQHRRQRPWWGEVAWGETVCYATRRDALDDEAFIIATQAPLRNILRPNIEVPN